MNRQKMIGALEEDDNIWDIIIIGGGATGLGAAVDAASRGYKTLLLEQSDFAKGTSSRSTKLIHGGVRYLQQGDISLVLEALHERGLLKDNAPHLVSNQAFIIPNYDWWGGPFYTIGLKVYDMLAGRMGLGPSKSLSKEETLALIPTLEPKGLRGGVIYYDGQFDDSRLAINLAKTFIDHGGVAINYIKVGGLLKSSGLVCGVLAKDIETGKEYSIKTKVVVNATGVFVDEIIRMEDPKAIKMITTSQGVHIVLDKRFLPGNSAIMVPKTDDGRVLFAVPWHGKVLVGTTDTEIPHASLEPRALEEEINFLLKHASRYLSEDPTRKDVLSIFAGLRPLVKPEGVVNTAQISRSHTLMVTISGLVTITGGKWTTYRKMAEETVDKAALVAGLEEVPCKTKTLKIHGWYEKIDQKDPLNYFGSDRGAIKEMILDQPYLGEKLHENYQYLKASILWAVQHEMARSVEDVLARRTRALFLDARASIEVAPEVARIIAHELGKDQEWENKEVEKFINLAKEYFLDQ
ncbi:MAG: glycerol-3-phosphate dehydrogenase/oxidase [Bacteroidota bacterium]|nr:glycerol-3-phosphate dehydrogenase/oxidase [Bacteroidota bacterium]